MRKDKDPSTRQSPKHSTKKYQECPGFQTSIPSLSTEELAIAIKRRQAMAPPGDENPKDPQGSNPKSVKPDQTEGKEKQGTHTVTSDDKDKEQVTPVLDLGEKGDHQSKGDSESSEKDSLSEITSSSDTKRYSKYTQDQAGCHKRSFDSMSHKLLRNLLEFRHEDPVPVVLMALEDGGTRTIEDFIDLTDEDIDSPQFPTGHQCCSLGPSHKTAVQTLQWLIKDNTDKHGKLPADIPHLLTPDCIKRF